MQFVAGYPDEPVVASLQTSLTALEEHITMPFPDHDAAARMLERRDATTRIAVLWRRTSNRATLLPFRLQYAECLRRPVGFVRATGRTKPALSNGLNCGDASWSMSPG